MMLWLTVWSSELRAQSGSVDPNFVPPLNVGRNVTALALQTDEKVIVGGQIFGYPVDGGMVERLSVSGSGDASFTTSTTENGSVLTLALDPDGRVVVGGSFTIIAGQGRSRLARLSTSGALDADFNSGQGIDGDVLAVVVQPDGRILIGGKFATVNGTGRNGIARLNGDGSLDSSFDPGTGVGNPASNEVHSIALLTDGKVLVGGAFTTINGIAREHLARLNANGSIDLSFAPGSSPNAMVNALAVQTDGKIVVGGEFTYIGGTNRRRIARLNPDGSLDPTFNPDPGISSGMIAPTPGPGVEALALQDDGRILLGGSFGYVNGVQRPGLARLLADGTLDYDFDVRSQSPFGGFSVSAIALQPDGKILAGGAFSSIDGAIRHGVARLNEGGGATFPGRFEFISAQYQINEGAGVLTAIVKRTGGSSGAATVGYSTTPGTATAAADFAMSSGTLSFASGETQKTFQVSIVDDSLAENQGCCSSYVDGIADDFVRWEVFSMRLQNPAGGAIIGSQSSTLVVIEDNDTSFALEAGQLSVGELDGRSVVRIGRTGTTSGINTVKVTTSGGTATAGMDYVARSEVIVFAPGEAVKDVLITILEDEAVEGNETLTVTLSEPTGGATLISPGIAVLTIVDRPDAVVSTWPGAVDNSFFPGWWQDGQFNAIAIGDGGRIFVSGYFYRTGGDIRHLAWLYPDGSLDESFRAPPALGAGAFALQPDNRVVVAALNYSSGNVFRLNVDGSEDTTFGPASFGGGYLGVIVRQNDGRFIVAGNFTNVNGVARQWIARLNGNGSLDPSFDPGLGPGGGFNPGPGIHAVALQDDGKLIVGGDFTTWSGTARTGIARLNANGSLDASFIPSGGGVINSIAIQNDHKLIIAGYGMTENGSSTGGIIRLELDGSVDATFNPSSVIGDGAISVMALQHDGKLVVSFATLSPFSYQLARLNGDGSLDATFSAGTGPDDVVRAVALQADGGVLIGGEFNSVNGRPRRGIARLIGGDPPLTAPLIKSQPASTTVIEGADVSFSVVTTAFPFPTFAWTHNGAPVPGATGPSLKLMNVRLADGGTYAVAVSNVLDTTTSSNATLIVLPAPTQPGAVDLSFRAGPELLNWTEDFHLVGINRLAVQGDGKFVIAAAYSRSGYFGLERVVRLNPDGSLDGSFNPGAAISGGGVGALAVQPDGKILVAGWFFEVNGVRSANIVRLTSNGTLDATFVPDGIASYTIEDLVVQADGKIVLVGRFEHIDGVPRRGIARLLANGKLDLDFDPGQGVDSQFQPDVAAVALQGDGKILLGGNFTMVAGQPRQGVARLNPDGSLDDTFQPGAGTAGSVLDIAIQPDGRILIAGSFDHFDGIPRNRVARLNADGTLDSAFDPGSGPDASVQQVVLQGDGSVLIAGPFSHVAGVTRAGVARLTPNGSIDPIFDPGSGANESVDQLALLADGGILIGGFFATVDARPRLGIARLLNHPAAGAGAVEFTEAGSLRPESTGGTIQLRVRRVGASRGLITFNYGVSGGSTADGADYLFTAGTLSFADGDTSEKTISLTILDDQLPEGDETIDVWLANPLGGAVLGSQAATRITIVEDDTAVELTATEYDVREWSGLLMVNVRRLGRMTGTFTVACITSDESAWAGADYVQLDSTLHFASGETNQMVFIQVKEDEIVEPDETFRLDLSNPQGAQLGGRNSAIIGIADDDRPGTQDTSFRPQLALWSNAFDPTEQGIKALALLADGRLLVAGALRDLFRQAPVGIVRLWPNGSLDSSFSPGGRDANGAPVVVDGKLIAIQPDGRVLVVPDGIGPSLVRLSGNGILDELFQVPAIEGDSLNALLVQPDGKILIGGSFIRVNGVPRNGIARLRSNGSLDDTFDPGAGVLLGSGGPDYYQGDVSVLAMLPDGRILVGGRFDEFDGALSRCLVRLNGGGTVDTTFDPGRGFEGGNWGGASPSVDALVLQPDGRILAAGRFTHVDGIERPRLARIHYDGALDLGFVAGMLPCTALYSEPEKPIRALALQPDGRILVGGALCVGGILKNLLRLNRDGSIDEDFESVQWDPAQFGYGGSPSPEVRAIILESGGQVLIGGLIYPLNVGPASGLVRINGGVFRLEFGALAPLAGNGANLHLALPRGQGWILQASGNLINWFDLNGGVPLMGVNQFTDTEALGNTRRFYRARLAP